MPGLLSWFTSWLDSTGSDSDDQSLTDLNVAVNSTIIKSRDEMSQLIDQNLFNGTIIKLHYDDCIEQTLRRFLHLAAFTQGDIHSIRQRLIDCQTLNTLELNDNGWDTHSIDESTDQSALVDSMLAVFRSWIKLDVLDGDLQQALLIILDEIKQSINKALDEQIQSIKQSNNQLIRVCVRVPTLNIICVLLINVESINSSIQISHLSSRVTLFDEFSNAEDIDQVDQVLQKLETSDQTFYDAEHRASQLTQIKQEIF